MNHIFFPSRACAPLIWGTQHQLENLGSIHITDSTPPVVDPFVEALFPDGVFFQRDNVPCHEAEAVLEWFEEPSSPSPDFSPIKHQVNKQATELKTSLPLISRCQIRTTTLLQRSSEVPTSMCQGCVYSKMRINIRAARVALFSRFKSIFSTGGAH